MIHLFDEVRGTACGLDVTVGTMDTYTTHTDECVTRTPGAENCIDCIDARIAKEPQPEALSGQYPNG